MEPEQTLNRRQAQVGIAVFVIAVLLRIPGLFTDFWFDEVWSVHLGQRANNLIDIFVLNHDNNHYLNSILVFVLGPNRHAVLYRLLSLFGGVTGLAAAGYHFWRRRSKASFVFFLLYACSYPLLHYCSEARGYATAYGVATVMWVWLQTRNRDVPDSFGKAILYGLGLIVGFLAHITFVYCAVAFCALITVRAMRNKKQQVQGIFQSMMLHLPFGLVALVIYWVDIRKMEIGMAREADMLDATAATLSSLMGVLVSTPLAFLFAALVIFFIALTLYRLFHARRYDEFAFVAALVLTIAVIVTARHNNYIYPRYILVAAPFFLWYLAETIERLLCRNALWRIGVWTAIVLLCGAGLFQSVCFMVIGKGQYRKAVLYMAEHTPGPTVTVSSDFDFRQKLLIGFHSHDQPKSFIYVPRDQMYCTRPDWIIAQHPTSPDTLDAGEYEYQLTRVYPSYGLSGWQWQLYKKRKKSGN